MSLPPPQRRKKNPSTVPSGAAATAGEPSSAPTRRSRIDRAQARRLLAILHSGGDARAAKIRRVRRSVRQASYENQLKLSVALDRMLAQLNAER
jgi:hypothetical protein